MGNAFLYGKSGGKQKLNVVTLTTSQIWTVPSGVSTLLVWMCGGGAGGDRNANNTAGNTYNVYGGSSGHVVFMQLTVTPGQAFPVIIGAGGAGRKSTNGVGVAGGDTSFGDYIAKGGQITGGSGTILGVGGSWRASLSESGVFNNMLPPGSGLDGTSPIYPGVTQKGYCPLTGETYCGSGSSGYFVYVRQVPNASGPSVNNGVGGGGGAGAFSVTNYVPNISPGKDGSAFGAGGSRGNQISIYAGEKNPSNGYYGSDGGNGYQGVVILGWYA